MPNTITSALTVEAKKIWLNGDFGTSDEYKCALILGTGAATFNKNTRYYTDLSTNEHGATGNYSTGGVVITKSAGPTNTNGSETNGYLDFTDAEWTNATLADVRGCVVYNNTNANKTALFWLDFGGTYSVTSGTFRIEWPAAAEGTAIIRIA